MLSALFSATGEIEHRFASAVLKVVEACLSFSRSGRCFADNGGVTGLIVSICTTWHLVKAIENHQGTLPHFFNADTVSVVAIASLD